MNGWLRYIGAHSLTLGTLVAAIYLLAAVCAVREVMNSRTSQGSIAWLVSLGLVPFPTSFIYLVFGWKHFDDYAAVKALTNRKTRPRSTQDLALIDEETSKAWPVLTRISQLPFLTGNEAHLLIDGEATFDSIFKGIDEAKSYLLVQFYTVRDDALGRRLADHLIARARAGVKTYLLYDDIGSSGMPRRYLDRLREGGVRVSAFNHRHKFLRLYGPTRLNYRNHRKNVIADGREAWVGGHNVGISYLGLNPKFGRWRDTQVHVEGPVAHACALVFREDWHWATGEELTLQPPEKIATPGVEPILAMPTGPADRLEDCSIAFSDVIGRARERLWIVSPYFVPDLDMRTALYSAVLRGVDVRIMLPQKPDHLLVWLASNAHAHAMVEHEVEIYRYFDGFLHQKVILVDDAIAGVGTVNFDNRSFNINFELTLWFTGPRMIADVEAMLEIDFTRARKTTAGDLARRSFMTRFVGQAAKLFSPIL